MRRRITLVAVNAAVLAVALFGGALAVVVWRYTFTDERSELERAADRAAVVAALDRTRPGDPLEIPAVDEDITITVYAPDGHRTAGRGPVRASRIARAALAGRVDDEMHGATLRVAVPVAAGDRVVAAVEASSPRSALLQRIALLWLGLVAMAGLALVPPAVAARRAARRLAEPLEALAGAAQRLGDGRFELDLPASDIQEIDTASHRLTETARRLGALVARERSFARDASHQLRTPLTGMRLLLETGLESDPETLRGSAAHAVTMVDRLEERIADLLRLRTEPGAAGPVDVTEVLEDVKRTYSGVLTTAGRRLRVVEDDDVPEGWAPTAAVRQVTGVLVDNAVRHGRGDVTVHARNASGVLAVDVADEGAGVAGVPHEDVLSWPDDPPPAARGRAGAHGLGLRMARELVAAAGGRLLYRDGPGARFTILVPGDPGRATDDAGPGTPARTG